MKHDFGAYEYYDQRFNCPFCGKIFFNRVGFRDVEPSPEEVRHQLLGEFKKFVYAYERHLLREDCSGLPPITEEPGDNAVVAS